jgi:hypothetical protein
MTHTLLLVFPGKTPIFTVVSCCDALLPDEPAGLPDEVSVPALPLEHPAISAPNNTLVTT